MKKLFFTLLLGLFCMGGFAQEVTIDKENCTITKDGKTFPLYGEVRVVDNCSADFTVKIVEHGSCDLEVKTIEVGSPTSCGEWKFVSTGDDFSIRYVEHGSADIEIKFVEYGSSGLSVR